MLPAGFMRQVFLSNGKRLQMSIFMKKKNKKHYQPMAQQNSKKQNFMRQDPNLQIEVCAHQTDINFGDAESSVFLGRWIS